MYVTVMIASASRASLLLGVAFASLAWADRPPSHGLRDGGTSVDDGERFLQTLSASEREHLKKDELVVLNQKAASGGPLMVRAAVHFKRPVNEVFALVTRARDQSTYLPHVQQSKQVEEANAEGERIDFVISMLFTFKYRTQHWYYPEEHRIEWFLDPSGEPGLAEQEGSWQFYALDDGTTIGEYATHVVTRSAFLNFFRSLGERGGVADALTAMKRHVDTTKL